MSADERTVALWSALADGDVRLIARQLHRDPDADDVERCPVCGDKNCWREHEDEQP